jgi:hypothetical protein
MNNRESSSKVSKNQFRLVVEQRICIAKKKAEPEPLSQEEQALADTAAQKKVLAKAAGFLAWQAKKAEKKRLRSKRAE